ncbi:MAG: GNAT family N-acetyltransferase [Tissierellales bacterium]|jgi:ribosomal-protein-alanine N-acetyltransferase|nr:GNAT family N-acetyltransferase [Tissierellales bacterium]
MTSYIFESERLGFRIWRETDRKIFAAINADKETMKYFPSTMTKDASNDLVDRFKAHMAAKGFGPWAVEIKETGEFIGYIGFSTAVFIAEFTPCVEIGWRLDKSQWHNGYATEGAQACLKYGFENLGFDEVYSFTAELNEPSENVMKRLGMSYVCNFDHPKVEDGSKIKNHKLYKITKQTWKKIKK